MKYLAVIISVILFASCSTQRQIKKCQKCFNAYSDTTRIIKDSTVVLFDTTIHILEVSADTSIQIIQIVCDSSGNATIKTSTTKKGNRSDLNTTLENNTLTIQASCDKIIDSLEFIIKHTERHLSKEIINTLKLPKIVEAKLTWWQKIKIRFGGWSFLIIILYLIYRIAKKYYKVNTPMGLILTLKRRLIR